MGMVSDNEELHKSYFLVLLLASLTTEQKIVGSNPTTKCQLCLPQNQSFKKCQKKGKSWDKVLKNSNFKHQNSLQIVKITLSKFQKVLNSNSH